MTLLQAIILGIVQGLSEFLPISSSAHLVLVPFILNWKLENEAAFVFDVLVQMGTVLAVIIYFRKDLWQIIKAMLAGIKARKPFENPNARLGWLLILATIPAGLAGIFLKDSVEAAFASIPFTAIMLFVTALLLTLAEIFGKRLRSLEKLTWLDAIIMGVFQAAAIFPGVSRSGSTISGGMYRQIDRKAASRFSFLMSIPIMLAAGGLSLLDLRDVPNLSSFLPVMLAGFIVAGVVGFFAIQWLLKFINKHAFYWFAGYCVLFGSACLILNHVR